MSLADVLPSCLSALAGETNRLGLPPVAKAVVLLIDGLGAGSLRARAGHARTLAGAMTSTASIDSVFPTTTAAALATLTTGLPPGQHGLVGYSVFDARNDRVVNQLSGWDDLMQPMSWQVRQTVFERAVVSGFRAGVVAPERYRDSGFSAAVLRGAEFLAATTITERLERAREWMSVPGDGLLYVYVPELDATAHAQGWQSARWTDWLETLDSAVSGFVRSLRASEGLLVTADHGIIDIPGSSHVFYDAVPALLDGVRFVAGEPRCLQLYLEPGLTAVEREDVAEHWRASESARAWVVTRDQAIAANWFGEVRPEVADRIGDLLVAARKNIAYYDTSPASARSRAMIGQHGSWSQDELRVPLLRFGAFARQP